MLFIMIDMLFIVVLTSLFVKKILEFSNYISIFVHG